MIICPVCGKKNKNDEKYCQECGTWLLDKGITASRSSKQAKPGNGSGYRGLAVASFVLGTIGFLFSFVFGLGFLPSILALIFGIFPLIKGVSRAMAIPGLILGILGIFISVSFFAFINEIFQPIYSQSITSEKPDQTYGKFAIKLAERHPLNIEGDKFVFSAAGGLMEPEKGMEPMVVLLNFKNDGNKWVYPNVMPGSAVDPEGEEYREEGDAVRTEKDQYSASIETTALGKIKVVSPGVAEANKIGPGETFDWILIFYIPQGRAIKGIKFGYTVTETAYPLSKKVGTFAPEIPFQLAP